MKVIEEYKPQVVFLDIEMPWLNGFAMLQRIERRDFEVIFVTAYDHYAIKAIKFSALDYLVKPVEIEDLKGAVGKAVERQSKDKENQRLDLLLENLKMDKEQKWGEADCFQNIKGF
ncbi:MAG: response regulator [Bacteroidetes bacterium]|nr:response regulator [Bacteroidota bacterium]